MGQTDSVARSSALASLRVRLVPAAAPVDDPAPATQQFGSNFRLELVSSIAGARRVVTEAGARELGLEPADAIRRGWRATVVLLLATVSAREHALAPGVTVALASADDNPFVSVGLTSVERLFRLPPSRFGALVAAPRLSALLCFPVQSTQALAVAGVLEPLTSGLYRAAHDPCSPRLFWHHDGRIHPVSVLGNRFTVPAELEPLVAELPSP